MCPGVTLVLTAVCVYRAQQLKQPLARTVSSVTVAPLSAHPAAAERVRPRGALAGGGCGPEASSISLHAPHPSRHLVPEASPCVSSAHPSHRPPWPREQSLPSGVLSLRRVSQSWTGRSSRFHVSLSSQLQLDVANNAAWFCLNSIEQDRAQPAPSRGSETHPCGRGGRCRAVIPTQLPVWMQPLHEWSSRGKLCTVLAFPAPDAPPRGRSQGIRLQSQHPSPSSLDPLGSLVGGLKRCRPFVVEKAPQHGHLSWQKLRPAGQLPFRGGRGGPARGTAGAG